MLLSVKGKGTRKVTEKERQRESTQEIATGRYASHYKGSNANAIENARSTRKGLRIERQPRINVFSRFVCKGAIHSAILSEFGYTLPFKRRKEKELRWVLSSWNPQTIAIRTVRLMRVASTVDSTLWRRMTICIVEGAQRYLQVPRDVPST